MQAQDIAADHTAAKYKFFYGWIVLAVAFFILAIIWGTSMSYGVYFDPFMAEFGWTRATISAAASINNLVFGIFCIAIARLCDRYKPQFVIGACGLVLALGYFLMSQTSALWQLYFYYGVLVALGMSAYIATLAIVARWFTKRRGLATGIVLSGMGLGVTVMPPVTNWLIATYEWRTSLIMFSIVTLLVMLPGAKYLKRDPRQLNQPPSGMNRIPVPQSGIIEVKGLSFREALRTSQFWLICGMYFIFLFCLLIVMVHIVVYAIGLGISPAGSAITLSIVGGFSIVGMNVVGMTADRFGNRPSLAASFMLTAIAYLWLLVAKDTLTLYVFAAVFGFAYGGMQVLFSPLVAEMFGLKAHGVILATCAFFGTIGAAIGPFFAGFIFDSAGYYDTVFKTAAVLAVVAVVMALFMRATHFK